MPRRRQYFGTTAEGAGPHFGQLRRYGGAVFGQMEVDNDIRSALRAILPADQPPAVSTSIGRVRLWRVTLSRKGAKSRTRGRKLHLTGTKARVAWISPDPRRPRTAAQNMQTGDRPRAGAPGRGDEAILRCADARGTNDQLTRCAGQPRRHPAGLRQTSQGPSGNDQSTPADTQWNTKPWS
jgi:hypothetical protein